MEFSEDVVILGQAILDEEGSGRRSSNLKPPNPVSTEVKQDVVSYDSTLLTASDVREEIHQELKTFASESLHAEFVKLGAQLRQEFRSVLEDLLPSVQHRPSTVSVASKVKFEGSLASPRHSVTGLGSSWKEEMRSLLESEFAKQAGTRNHVSPPRKVEKQKIGKVPAKESTQTVRPSPFSARPYRAYVAHTAMQEFDVQGSERARSRNSNRSRSSRTGIDSKLLEAEANAKKDRPWSKESKGRENTQQSKLKRAATSETLASTWQASSSMPVSKEPGKELRRHTTTDPTQTQVHPFDDTADLGCILPSVDATPVRSAEEKASPRSALTKSGSATSRATVGTLYSMFGGKGDQDSRLHQKVRKSIEQFGEALSTRPRRPSEERAGLTFQEDSVDDRDGSPCSSENSEDGHRSGKTEDTTAGPTMSENRLNTITIGGHRHQRKAVFITKESGKSKEQMLKDRQRKEEHAEMSQMRQRIARIVNSVGFDISTGALIAVNALWIGIQTDIMAQRGKDKAIPDYFRVTDSLFAVLFSLELCLRLYVSRWGFFTEKGRMWNLFDTLLVAAQLTEEAMAWDDVIRGNTTGGNSTNFSFMRILRVLRFIRVLRLVRIVRLIGELRTIVCSIAGSLKSLGWTICLLTLLIYVVGIYFTQLVADHGAEDKELVNFFGSLARSLLSLFAAFTGGVDWDQVASPLIDTIHPFCGVVFALYIAFAVLAMMNVVTGVFVESALMTARHDKDVDLVNTLREVFMKTDEDATGTIEWAEFERHIQDPQMEVIFKAVDLDRSEARGLFELIDVEDKGEISREEFIMGCLRLKGPAKALDLATLMYDVKRVTNMMEDHFGMIENTLTKYTTEIGVDGSTSSNFDDVLQSMHLRSHSVVDRQRETLNGRG